MLLRLFKGFLFVIVIFLFLFVTFGSSAIEPYIQEKFGELGGENFAPYVFIALIVAVVITVLLTSDFWKKLIFNTSNKADSYNVPAIPSIYQSIKEARNAIGNAQPETAIKILNELGSSQLNNEMSLLSARWVAYNNSTTSLNPKDAEFNNINRSLLFTISTIEKQLGVISDKDVQIRKHLKKRYRKRLNQKMAGRQPVNIKRLRTTIGTSDETAAMFSSNADEEIQGEMSQLFDAANGRLLIVGEPGSGKTTLLLRWVDRLIETENEYLPVIVNLSTWNSGFVDFRAWLLEILPAELSVNKSLAREILSQDRLLLLCDGLDEVRKKDRETLLIELGKYGSVPSRKFSISSRIEEYKEISRDAPVNDEIELRPFTLKQLKTELTNEKYQPEGKRLLAAIDQDEYLRQAIQTPFYFNALQLLFANGIRLQDLKFNAESTSGREKELLLELVDFCLVSHGKSSSNKMRWLSYLANILKSKDLVSFELSNVQYHWWNWKEHEKYIAYTIQYFVMGLLSFFTGFLSLLAFESISNEVIAAVPKAASFGLLIGVIVILYTTKEDDSLKINTKETTLFSWRMLWQFFKRAWLRILGIGIFVGLMFYGYFLLINSVNIETKQSVFGYKIKDIFNAVLDKARSETLYKFLDNSGGSLFVSIAAGTILISLGISLFLIAITIGTKKSEFLQIESPFQRFNASAKNLYFSVLQYWHLMHLFEKYNLLPRKLVPFLDEMTKSHILESDGASWRFRHRILQDYFAEQWENTYAKEYEKEQHKEPKT